MEVVSLTPRQLYPRERIPDTNWIGGWVGPRDGQDEVAKKKIPASARNRTPIVRLEGFQNKN
jgi:hypothetical protein